MPAPPAASDERGDTGHSQDNSHPGHGNLLRHLPVRHGSGDPCFTVNGPTQRLSPPGGAMTRV